MSETPYRLTSLTLLLLAVALMVLAAEVFSAPITIVASKWGPASGSGGGGSSYYALPEANQTLWQANVIQGIPGGIPARTTHVTNAVTAFSADNTGASDAQAAITSAISATPSNGTVYLPAGRYRLNADPGTKTGVTIRGAGMTNTIITNNGVFTAFSKDVSTLSTFNNLYKAHEVTAGLTKGSTNISVTWNPTMYGIAPGHAIMIGGWCSTNQTDNPLFMNVVGEFNTNSMFSIPLRSIHVCISTNANGLTFWPPLALNYPTHYNNRVAPHSTVPGGAQEGQRLEMFGLEDLTIDCRIGGIGNGISWIGVENCWLKNVRVLFPQNRAVLIQDSHHIEITGCELRMDPAIAANHAGLEVDNLSFSYVYNNLIVDSFPAVQNNSGIANIFAYNFMWRNDYADTIVGSHNAGHSAMNLWEGNIANRTKIGDGYNGSAGPETYFRNWFHGANSNNSPADAIITKRFTRGGLVVANVIGKTNQSPTYSQLSEPWGTPNVGNTNYSGTAPPWADWLGGGKNNGSWQELDTNAAPSIVGCWNYFSNAVDTALGSQLLSNSLYLAAQPSFVWRWPLVQPMSPDFNWTNMAAGAAWTNGGWN